MLVIRSCTHVSSFHWLLFYVVLLGYSFPYNFMQFYWLCSYQHYTQCLVTPEFFVCICISLQFLFLISVFKFLRHGLVRQPRICCDLASVSKWWENKARRLELSIFNPVDVVKRLLLSSKGSTCCCQQCVCRFQYYPLTTLHSEVKKIITCWMSCGTGLQSQQPWQGRNSRISEFKANLVFIARLARATEEGPVFPHACPPTQKDHLALLDY